MSMRYLIYAIISVVIIVMVWVTMETFNQPGINDLDVEFEEMANYRNENNTGPILRVYTVYTPDTLWLEMKKYGDFMPHTKYGNTKVYFFDQKEFIPDQINPAEPVIESQFQKYCVGVYEKSAMGEVRFTRFPFR